LLLNLMSEGTNSQSFCTEFLKKVITKTSNKKVQHFE